MAKIGKLRVKLLAYTRNPEQNIVAAIRQCYSSVGASELKKKTDKETCNRLINQVLESGHTSTIEHAVFTFAVEGISRACSHQLVRHRIASYSQQSQRYVDLSKKGLVYIVPPEITKNKELFRKYVKVMNGIEGEYGDLIKAGVKPEDARFVLPNACETKIVMTMNARSLLNFFRERCCQRAQWEIKALAGEMLKEVKKVAPVLFKKVGATCMTDKVCWEGKMSCGLWQKVKGGELKSRI